MKLPFALNDEQRADYHLALDQVRQALEHLACAEDLLPAPGPRQSVAAVRKMLSGLQERLPKVPAPSRPQPERREASPAAMSGRGAGKYPTPLDRPAPEGRDFDIMDLADKHRD